MFDRKCHRCQEQAVPPGCLPLKTYEVTGNTKDGQIKFLYDVSAAYVYAKERHTPAVVPYETARDLIFTNLSETFCGAHVAHVDPSFPALIGIVEGKLILMDGTHRIMISKALNESDRLSGCSKGVRKYMANVKTDLFNVFSFQTVEDSDTGGIPDEFLVRYNSELANNLGNLVNRTLNMTTRFAGGVVPPAEVMEDPERELQELWTKTRDEALPLSEGFQFHTAPCFRG